MGRRGVLRAVVAVGSGCGWTGDGAYGTVRKWEKPWRLSRLVDVCVVIDELFRPTRRRRRREEHTERAQGLLPSSEAWAVLLLSRPFKVKSIQEKQRCVGRREKRNGTVDDERHTDDGGREREKGGKASLWKERKTTQISA